MQHGKMTRKISSEFLVLLEFEIKLEPLLLSCPPTATATTAPLCYFFLLRLVLETPNLVHTLERSIQAFLKKKLFDLNLYLYLMV